MSSPERFQPSWDRLRPGEIDLTGVVTHQPELFTVMGDAVAELEKTGELPLWGARAMARHLANTRRNIHSGGLHHFAVMGNLDVGAVIDELTQLDETPDLPRHMQLSVHHLGAFVLTQIERLGHTLDHACGHPECQEQPPLPFDEGGDHE